MPVNIKLFLLATDLEKAPTHNALHYNIAIHFSLITTEMNQHLSESPNENGV